MIFNLNGAEYIELIKLLKHLHIAESEWSCPLQ